MIDENGKDDAVSALLASVLECRKILVSIRDDLRTEGHAYTLAYTRADVAILKLDKMLRTSGYEKNLVQSVGGGGLPFPMPKS